MPWSAVTTDFTWIDLQFLLWIAEGNLRLGMLRRQKYMAWFKRQLTGNLCSCIPITWTYYPLLEQGKISMRNQQQTHTTGKSWSDQLMETIKTCETIWAPKCNLVLSLPSTHTHTYIYIYTYDHNISLKKRKTTEHEDSRRLHEVLHRLGEGPFLGHLNAMEKIGVTPADLWKIPCLDDLVALETQKHPYGEFIEFMKNSNFPEMVWSLSAKHWLFHELLVVEVCWEEEFTTWDGTSKVATGRYRGRLKMKHAATYFLPQIGTGIICTHISTVCVT